MWRCLSLSQDSESIPLKNDAPVLRRTRRRPGTLLPGRPTSTQANCSLWRRTVRTFHGDAGTSLLRLANAFHRSSVELDANCGSIAPFAGNDNVRHPFRDENIRKHTIGADSATPSNAVSRSAKNIVTENCAAWKWTARTRLPCKPRPPEASRASTRTQPAPPARA